MNTHDRTPSSEVGAELACVGAARAAIDSAVSAGIDVPSDGVRSLAAYCSAIVDVSARTNVTALRSPEQIGRGLILDSLTILGALAPYGLLSPSVVDVGSGGGVPGIPLAIARPMWSFLLVESIEKKAAFLRRVVADLSLAHVQVRAERAETIGAGEGRECFDVVVARAVASLPTLLEWCAPLLRPNGLIALPKSGAVSDEIASARIAAEILNLAHEATYPVPESLGLGANRFVVLYRKTGPTPSNFPREVGTAKIRPLGGAGSSPARPHGRSRRRE